MLRTVLSALLVGAALAGLVNPAVAGGCFSYYGGSYYYPTYTYQAPTYYAPPYKEKERVVVLEYYPLFPVGVTQPYRSPPRDEAVAETPCDAKLKALESKFDALSAKLAAGGSAVGSPSPTPPQPPLNTAPPPMPKATDPLPKSVLAGPECARCHDAKVSSEKGGGLSLSRDGSPLKLTAEQTGKCIEQSMRKTMPKGGNGLPPDRLNDLLNELVDLAARK